MHHSDPLTPKIECLAKQGVRPCHIADQLGVSRQRVYTRIGWLRRAGEDIPEFPRGAPGGAIGRPRKPRLRAMPDDLRDRLAEIAEMRGQSIEQLATRLLTVIVRDDLVDAILDDGETTT